MIWTKDGEELANSRHVQLRERENKTTLQLINLKPSMAGEYRLVVVSFVWKLWGKYKTLILDFQSRLRPDIL